MAGSGKRAPSTSTRLLAALTGASLVIGTSALALVPAASASASSVSADRAQIAQLEQQIAAQGAQVQQIVSQYDVTQGQVNALQAKLAIERARLASDQRSQALAAAHLRSIAIYAYESGGGLSSALSLFGNSNLDTVLERSEYIQVAGGNVKQAIDAYEQDARATASEAQVIRGERQKAQATLVQLAAERNSVQAAIANEETTLGQVKGNLQSVLAAIAAQHAAEERAAEEAIARQEAAQAAAAAAAAAAAQAARPAPPSPVPTPPPPPSVNPAPGTYVNPLRAISGLNPERIDQGVDYSGYGPIYAIGDGVVLNTVNAGWPGGTFITYRLTDGPASGLVVYAAEDIYPMVQVGQTVTPNTVLGEMYEGPDGIETGWADSSGQGYTMAHDYGQFNGSNSTAFGYNFSQLLQYLGAPGGILQNNPPTGTLPPGWPTW